MSRVRRESRVFDASGAEVFITYPCTFCATVQPLRNFGLRKMDDGKIRSIPWCRKCRGGSERKGRETPAKPLTFARAASPRTIARAQARLAARGIHVAPVASRGSP